MDAATLELLELADPANWETKRKSAPPKQSYQAWSKQFNPRKGRHAQKGGGCGKISGSTTGRRLKKNDRRRLQQLATALARRVLVQDEQQKEALQQARELKHQVAELEAWKRVVTIQAREEAKERQVVQKRLAEREASVFKREQRVRAREAAVESRTELLHTIDALERELARVKKANRVEDHVNDEVQRRYRRLDQELGFAKQEVRALEGTFVEHLYDLFKLRVELESKSVRDDDLGTTRRRNEKAREDLQARLRIACAEGGENSGTGLGIIAAELLQAVQVSYGRAADYAEEMRMENVQLDDECSTLRERLTHTLDENALNKRKLRSEEVGRLTRNAARCLLAACYNNVSDPDLCLHVLCCRCAVPIPTLTDASAKLAADAEASTLPAGGRSARAPLDAGTLAEGVYATPHHAKRVPGFFAGGDAEESWICTEDSPTSRHRMC